jgi:Na+/alanine symporter
MLYTGVMKSHVKKYYLRMTLGLVAYVSGLFALNYFYNEQSPHRYWLITLPVLPIIYLATVIIRFISEVDEMWRKIFTEALAFSAVATGFSCLTYLFLRDMGAPEFHADWAYYMMWGYYGIGLFFSWRRYK